METLRKTDEHVLFDSQRFWHDQYLYNWNKIAKQIEDIIDENTKRCGIVEISDNEGKKRIQIIKQLWLLPDTWVKKVDDFIERLTPKWLKPRFIVYDLSNWTKKHVITKWCTFSIWKEWQLIVSWVLQKTLFDQPEFSISFENGFKLEKRLRYDQIVWNKIKKSLLHVLWLQEKPT